MSNTDRALIFAQAAASLDSVLAAGNSLDTTATNNAMLSTFTSQVIRQTVSDIATGTSTAAAALSDSNAAFQRVVSANSASLTTSLTSLSSVLADKVSTVVTAVSTAIATGTVFGTDAAATVTALSGTFATIRTQENLNNTALYASLADDGVFSAGTLLNEGTRDVAGSLLAINNGTTTDTTTLVAALGGAGSTNSAALGAGALDEVIGNDDFRLLSGNTLTLTDNNATGTSAQTATGAITTGTTTMTADFTTALSAANLNNVLAGTGGTSPTIGFGLAFLPTSGTSTAPNTVAVTMLLKDGTSELPRETSQRQITASYSMGWYSDGTSLVLNNPSNATVTYFSAGATSASTATLNNSAVGVLTVTGTSGGPSSTQIQARVTALMAGITDLSGVNSTGNYFYKITLLGLPLADGSTPSLPFSTVSGTFSVNPSAD